MSAIELTIDASDLLGLIDRLKANMTEVQFYRAMYTIFNRTGRHVSAILRKDLPQKYEVKAGDITAAVKTPQLSMGFNGVGCIIPISAPRGTIGSQYKASGSARGWQSKRRKYRVKARILKGAQSTLPDKWHSGYPPFRNMPSKLNSIAYARSGPGRGPILKLTGIAIPQMPTNRSEPDVQRDIKEFLEREMEQRLQYLIMSGR